MTVDPVAPAVGTALYQGNRPPLVPSPLVKLPIGAVRADGWLAEQLRLQADGFIGHLPELSRFCQWEQNAWTQPDGAGERGWEELPYWLRGYLQTGYLAGDQRIIDEGTRWIEALLEHQWDDGYFGSRSNRESLDLWPNMLVMFALRTHWEATGDARVIGALTRYLRWMSRQPLHEIYPGSWQKIRGGDALDSILWLHAQTGEDWLVDLARVNHERTADWVGGFPTPHGVNICEGFREPGQYYQVTGDRRYLDCTERLWQQIRERYGHTPGGLFGADENARPGYTGPRQAAETCSIAEFMYSAEMLCRITGEGIWADRCEDVCFNMLPASMTPDLRGLHYLTAPNMVQLDRASKAPLLQNGGDMLSFNPWQYRCCQHNVAFGWPSFIENLWCATADAGLAAMLYAPCRVTARVGDGTAVTIHEATDYPFGETITFTVTTPKPVRFPLRLRIPGWCAAPRLTVAGTAEPVPAGAEGWVTIDRQWRDGETVEWVLPMTLSVEHWPGNRNTVSVDHGPLTYSLRIGERWVKYGDSERWPGFEVFPTTPWNYGLELEAGDLTVRRSAKPVAAQPWTPETAPVTITAPARRIPNWRLEPNGLIGEVQPGPVRSEEPRETVTLIPMGCARLRVSQFPRIGAGPDALDWRLDELQPSASHCHESDTVTALDDGLEPASSADASIPRFTWWDHLGTKEWVQYDFREPRRVGGCRVYWFDDAERGNCRTPNEWRVLWLDGDRWRPVVGNTPYEVAADRYCQVRFEPVETRAVRLEVQLRLHHSGGILEWILDD